VQCPLNMLCSVCSSLVSSSAAVDRQGQHQLHALKHERLLQEMRALLGLLLNKGTQYLLLDRLRCNEGSKLQVCASSRLITLMVGVVRQPPCEL
jgi:hypothetical protein